MDIDTYSRGKEFKTYRQLESDHRKHLDYMVKCKCTHTILFTGIKDRLICSHCGHWVYKNKRTELKYRIKELLR